MRKLLEFSYTVGPSIYSLREKYENPTVSKMQSRTTTRHAPDLTGIYRLCDKKRGGDYLKVELHRNGQIFVKVFYVRRCGGEGPALKLAQAWRDHIIEQYPPISMAQFCSILRTNNTSGTAGVVRKVTRDSSKAAGAVERVYWTARIPLPDGKVRLQSFSVRTFGEDEAKRLAIAARQQGLQGLQGIVFRPDLQPEPVSGDEDRALLVQAQLAPSKRRAARAAQDEQRAQERLQRAQALAAKRRLISDAARAALQEPTNRSGEPYIGRYVNPGASAGNWRVSIERAGKRHRKTFSDSSYSGAAEALNAAKIWRDQVFLQYPLTDKTTQTTKLNSTNTSGVAGVYIARTAGDDHPGYWVARSPLSKGQGSKIKKFSIAKYGAEMAFVLAVAAREEFLKGINPAPHLQHRAARKLNATLAGTAAAGQ